MKKDSNYYTKINNQDQDENVLTDLKESDIILLSAMTGRVSGPAAFRELSFGVRKQPLSGEVHPRAVGLNPLFPSKPVPVCRLQHLRAQAFCPC